MTIISSAEPPEKRVQHGVSTVLLNSVIVDLRELSRQLQAVGERDLFQGCVDLSVALDAFRREPIAAPPLPSVPPNTGV